MITRKTWSEVLQSNYKYGHSTESALCKLKNDLLDAVGCQGAILAALDLSAVLETIHHSILLSLLESRIGIKDDALVWFKSYLTDRIECVFIDGFRSEKHQLAYGQSSVLGPVLFTVYTLSVGDIAKKNNLDFHVNPDDTQLFLWFRPLISHLKFSPATNQSILRKSSTPGLVTVPLTQTANYWDISFAKDGPLLWNGLPSHIQSISDFPTFKSHLKTVLFCRALD